MTTTQQPVRVGIIGAGVISQTYINNLRSFPDTQVVAVGDLFPEAAHARAQEFDIPHSGDADSVLNNPEVDLVINLTIPAAHVEVALRAIERGKHVWSEKPFSLDRASGQQLLAAASDAGVRLGCAPDTFLGEGIQEALRVIERGDIGVPLTAVTVMQNPGPELWHPNPAFLFQEGAGPLFDIGPYYLTTLVQTFGSISRVAALASTARKQRTIASGPRAGTVFDVTVPTHVSALIQFEGGGSAQSILSFESPRVTHGVFEVTGSEATLSFPDPNNFDGEIKICRTGSDEWESLITVTEKSSRGTGALEMARAIRENRPHRATGELAFHVVDAMTAIAESARTHEFVSVHSRVERSDLLPTDWDPHAAEL
ncbi:Gfo/Idh/MocA family oxidoreductase [Lysinibacter sp. HNR]|uniref:Gfo/Idh/MocA family protein n=1 Tax=Lysinibacter sp. HNR TaxID=3031408 RepID=UPI00243523D8|nr:Gfo/Idh/MocA family oxidoreductase [Lysinibacter sp. HNR]WGD37768.1 Gfo/Idh/MocA family oxidoreductase [Lysinibacter sp. HNR]